MESLLSRRLITLSVTFVSAAALVVACSGSTADTGDTSDSGAQADTGSGDDGGSSADTGGGQDTGVQDTGSDAPTVCNTLTNDSTPVPINLATESAPAATGGSVGDGTYDLSDITVYGSPVASTLGTASGKLVLAGNKADLIVVTGGKTTTTSGTFTVSGTKISLNQTCPQVQSQDIDFSVITGDAGKPQIVLFADVQGKTAGETFTKR